ncbi:ATP-binding protein [Streptomyces tendae]|uniref:ATP-binding protein n=1 Tax=Streptomyces tendae TaxID=1932 RepID=UPI0036B036C6
MSRTLLLKQSHHSFETVVPRELSAVSDIRRSAASVLRLWGMKDSLVDDVQLVVSEFVANAIEHGCGRVTLSIVETAGRVIIEVSDSSSAPALLRSADPDALRGRGLAIVAALAHRWGVGAGGCTTWAEFVAA